MGRLSTHEIPIGERQFARSVNLQPFTSQAKGLVFPYLVELDPLDLLRFRLLSSLLIILNYTSYPVSMSQPGTHYELFPSEFFSGDFEQDWLDPCVLSSTVIILLFPRHKTKFPCMIKSIRILK